MRFITGVIGCLMLISLCCTVQSVVPKRMISWATEISSSTLAIYAISSSLFIYLPQVLLRMKLSGVLSRIPVYLWDAAFLLPLSLALVAACLWVSKKLSRSRVFVLLLGK